MTLQSFKDLIVWQKACNLTDSVYKEFSNCRDYGFKDQIQRASISIANNIAEGYGRRSDKALNNFLTIARGSAAEVESMVLMSYNLKYIDKRTQQELLEQIEEIAKLITAFKNKIYASS